MSVLQFPSSVTPTMLGRPVHTAWATAVRRPRAAAAATVGAAIALIVVVAPAIVPVAGRMAGDAIVSVGGMPLWAAVVTMLGLFCIGGYAGHRERRARRDADVYDVR